LVPTHGEWRHLSSQAALAQEEGITPLLLENGDVLQFAPGTPAIVDSVPTGRLAVDGERIVPLKGGVLAARRRMLFNGVVVGSFAVTAQGKFAGSPKISAPGLFDEENSSLQRELEEEFLDLLQELPAPLRLQDAAAMEAARAALRKITGKRLGKRPIVEVHLLRV
jgi:ribonuclease J